MIKELHIALKAELLKFKNSYALLLAVLAPFLIAGMFGTIYFCKAHRLVAAGTNGMAGMLDGSINTASMMLFVFYIIILSILIHQIEHGAHSLKDLFSYPVSYFSTYTSKWIVAFILIGFSLILYILMSLLSVWIVSIRYPELMWLDSAAFIFFIKQVGIVFSSTLFMMAIQFLISLRWSNVIFAFSVGVVGFISAIILVNGWEYVHYHPYATGYLSYLSTTGIGKVKVDIWQYILYNAAGFVSLYIGGYFMWCKRRIV